MACIMMMKIISIILCVIFALCSPSVCAVFSVDLGSEWLKVSVVNLKKGQSPITVAINEMSKRKSPALVAFNSGDRLLAEEAAGLVARYPQNVYSQIRDLIGKPYGFSKKYLESLYLPFEIREDSRGGVSVKVDDTVGTTEYYSPEELVAMVLAYAARLAEFHSKIVVKDAVITVPPYFGQAERAGLLQAAQLAGINVLSLVNEHAGAALQYGIDKDFMNDSRHVIFYDMGSSSTYAALVYFSAYPSKESGKTVSVNQFQVKDVYWNPELGGQDMELRLVEHFADEFNKQVGDGFDVRKYPKAMAKLKKQVKRTKEILSANTAAPISVESLHADTDFRSSITREKFEELCADIWEKSLLPVKTLLANSGLPANQIYAVELLGGATRVPKLQAKLQEFFGRKELDRHLDADEAIVLGASLYAANLSDGIKMNRKLGMIDGSMYGFVSELNGPDLPKDEGSRQLLIPRMKKIPSKVSRSVIHNKDFEVSLAYESENLLPPGITSPEVGRYQVAGLTAATEKYSSRNLSSPIKVNLNFALSRSGILSLDRAVAVIEITEWVEVPKKNLTIDNSTSDSLNLTLETGGRNSSEESSEKLQTDGGDSKTLNTSAEDKPAVDSSPEKKLKKLTFRVPLKIESKLVGSAAMSLSKEFLAEAKGKLEALDKKDAERRRTAELKNDLEGYIYATKEKIETLEEVAKVSSDDERQLFVEKLDQVQDWLYTDGEDANATEFETRLNMLKAVGDPIFFRLKELTSRPEAVDYARKYHNELQQTVQGWKTNKSWLPKEDIDEVVKDAEKLKNWLDEKEAEQAKTSAFSKPAFDSDDVYLKVFDLQSKVARINKIPKPKPKIQKPSKNETESKNNTDSANSNPTDSTSQSDQPANENSEAQDAPQNNQAGENTESSRKEVVDEQSETHDEL